MNEQEIGRKIKGYLDSGMADMKPGTVFGLRRARELALSRLGELEHAPELALAGASRSLFGGRSLFAGARVLVGVLLLAGGVLAYQYWQPAQPTADIEETDAALLASDLPIDAYLDQGFQAWLKHAEP